MEFQTPNSENPDTPNPNNGETPTTQEPNPFSDDIDSTCSTPYVSAPSSPGRGPVTGFFYSAPASPMHFALSSLPISKSISSNLNSSGSFEFEFSARFGPTESGSSGSMISADELFLNGQIRPMKLSTHLESPQVLAPLLDLEVEDEDGEVKKDSENFGSGRGRDLRLRDKSMRRRTRSMSPLRNASFGWREDDDGDENESKSKDIISSEEQEIKENEFAETAPSISASSSRSSSAGRSSKRWVFLKDFLYRSKSEGRSNNKFWSTISFSPLKEKKPSKPLFVSREKSNNLSSVGSDQAPQKGKGSVQVPTKKLANGIGKRRLPPSAHELHYTANRAQAEEMRKKTYLPYRQGLLGCLGFSSKGYGAVNGFARALNPVSSR